MAIVPHVALARTFVLLAAFGAGVAEPTAAGAQTIGTFTWAQNGNKLEISCHGDIEFTDDDMDVRSITPGGDLRIKERTRTPARRIEFTADVSGNVERRFWVGSSQKPFETEGRQWLGEMLLPLIRDTGIGAASRVARFTRAKRFAALRAEISLLTGSWPKRLYLAELLKTPTLDTRTAQEALAQAGREVQSDSELRLLLAENQRFLRDEGTRSEYLRAAGAIASDFEMHALFSNALEAGMNSATLAEVLETATTIDTDEELGSLLVQATRLQSLDGVSRLAFFGALDTIVSVDERARVLAAVMDRRDVSSETTASVIAAAKLRSDFEKANLLERIAKQHSIDGVLHAPFFGAVKSITSSFERGRVLQLVARRQGASDETILGVLRAVQGMPAGFEAAQVLLAIAETQTLSGQLRETYVDVAIRAVLAQRAHRKPR